MVLSPWRSELDPSVSVTVGEHGTLRIHDFGTDETTDAFGFIAAVFGLDPRSQFPEVLARAAALLGWMPGSAPPPRRSETSVVRIVEKPFPDAAEVKALWSACSPVNTTGELADVDVDAAFFVRARHWWPDDVAELDVLRRLPRPEDYAWPRWWPAWWARMWRLAAPLYDAQGEMRSLQARRVTFPYAEPKCRLPLGRNSRGLVFADALGLRLLRGELVDADGIEVLIAEGLTDHVGASLWCKRTGRPWPVISVVSGAAPAFRNIRWPKGGRFFVATDNDAAGDRYAAAIFDALPRGAQVKRVNLTLKCGGGGNG